MVLSSEVLLINHVSLDDDAAELVLNPYNEAYQHNGFMEHSHCCILVSRLGTYAWIMLRWTMETRPCFSSTKVPPARHSWH
jgi:hypothetical protein